MRRGTKDEMTERGSTEFGGVALDDEEVSVVDIELDALEDGLDDILLSLVTIK
jgi:hypothetical protein